MKRILAFSFLVLGGCQGATTPEGCPIYATPMMQAQTQACVAAYHEEKARAAGAVVTRCTPVGNSVSCITY